MSYQATNKNPLLESLADQINQDPTLPSNQMTGFRLAHLILHALEMNIIEWLPLDLSGCCGHILISKVQWMQYFYNSSSFYSILKCTTLFEGYESILLHLVSNLLKRKICFISISSNDEDEFFEPKMLSSSRTIYLFGYRKAKGHNFYLSVFPNEYEVKESCNVQVSMK